MLGALHYFLLSALAVAASIFLYRAAQKRKVPYARKTDSHSYDYTDYRQQLLIVEKTSYECKPITNFEARSTLKVVETFFAEYGGGYRVLPELAMGAVLGTKMDAGFHCINSKRLDVGVVDAQGFLVVAVEYHGTGHYTDADTPIRDLVKKRALQKVGIDLIEVYPGEPEQVIRQKLQQRMNARPSG